MEKIGFKFTLGALKEVLERCPDGDLDKINTLFTGRSTVEILDNMAWFITILNRWYVYSATRSFDGALTEDDVLAFDIKEIYSVFDEAMKAFKGDSTPETEVEPTKK